MRKPDTKTPMRVTIRAEEITKAFRTGERLDKKLFVLRGINLEITKGEMIAVVGASGAGKSTLLHILGTLDRPTSGKVYYDDVDVFSLSDEDLARFRNTQVGFVFQFHHLLPEFSALENVAMPALIGGMSLREAEGKAMEFLNEVNLAERSSQRVTTLSGGEQQRVAVARALMNSPRIILADEPSGNLDTSNAQALHDTIWTLCRKYETTVVVVTHNEMLARRADRVLRIQDGVVQIP
jgi:lipoprotein-releasing system ATP-binding protein